ncbi:MAG: MATE family multidrug resistance protein [Porticoccus sp.]|jgi:MATE family multidrug resistance protein
MRTSKTLHQDIWSFTWPMVLTNLSIPLLGLVDTAILGHLGDARYLGAVAIGGSVIGLVYWAFSFLRMGTTSLSAQAFGAGQQDKAINILLRAISIGLMIGLAITVLFPPFVPHMVNLVGYNPESMALASSYINIRLLSAPAALITYAIVGWFLGQQKPKIPLIILVGTNFTNIILDWLFIIVLELHSDGAAIASVIAEYLGLVLGIGCLLYFNPKIFSFWRDAGLNKFAAYQELINVNRHLFVRTVVLLLAFMFFTAQGARQGDDVLAANAILMNLLLAVAFGLDGVAHAAEALIGKAVGGRKLDVFYATCQGCFQWSLVIACFITALFLIGETALQNLFTDIAAVKNIVGEYYIWLLMLPLVSVWSYLLDGIFVGAGKSKAMRDSMLLASIFVYAPVWYFTRELGNHGLWLAFVAWNLARSVSMGWLFYRFSRNREWIGAS